jgi:hypothetical protein
MFGGDKYGPYVCIGVVLAVLFVLWAFWGGKDYEFVGLAPLSPDTCGSYTGSVYNWGNITPANGYNPIIGGNCVPPVNVCRQENNSTTNRSDSDFLDDKVSYEDIQSSVTIDNTPIIPDEFRISSDTQVKGICNSEELQGGAVNISEELCINESQVVDVCYQNSQILEPAPKKITRCNLPAIGKRRNKFISRGERLCCRTMKQIYGVPFVSTRPDWLINPETGRKLELDCYNDELKIAVEYNGEQHYKWPNFTNQTYQEFINQVRRDTLKVNLCDRNGVYLISVPYNVSSENIPTFIMSHLPETIQKRLKEEQILLFD